METRAKPVAISEGSAGRTLLGAMGVNLINPNPWLGWTLIMGPALISAWHDGPASAAALLISFYAVIVGMTALIILLLGTTSLLSPRLRHSLILLSAIILAGLGVYRLVLSVG